MIKNKKYLILAVLWMACIFYLSHQPADVSSAQSGGVIEILSNMPIIDKTITYMMEIDVAQFIIRKSAHMFAYLLLAVFWFMSMYDKKVDLSKISSKAMIFTVLFACSDEVHQLFISGRSGEIRDVLVDSTGAAIGLILIYSIKKLKTLK